MTGWSMKRRYLVYCVECVIVWFNRLQGRGYPALISMWERDSLDVYFVVVLSTTPNAFPLLKAVYACVRHVQPKSSSFFYEMAAHYDLE